MSDSPMAALEQEAGLRDAVSRVLELARAAGADQAEAAAAGASGLSVRVRLGQVESVEHDRDKGLGVTVYFGARKGSASTTDLGPQALAATVQAACSIARHTGADPCNGLADAALMAGAIPDLDLHHPWELEPEAATDLARECEAAARAVDARIANSDGASVHRHGASRIYGNTHGFLGAWRGTRHSLGCHVIAGRGEAMQREGWYSVNRDPQALQSPEAVGRQAGERALARLGARRLSTRSAPVLFAAEVAASLLGHLVGAVRGPALYRRSSFLLDHLGRRIFPSGLRIHEQPHLPGALGSAPFDNEGVATRARDLVADGILQGYVLDSYSARRLGVQSTGNAGGVHNLQVAYRGGTREDLMARMGSGLLVTELMGMGVNLVTGDYSRGAAGFWVHDGRIAYPVQEITIAGSLPEMFMGIAAVGDDLDTRGSIRSGSILIEQMTIAGS